MLLFQPFLSAYNSKIFLVGQLWCQTIFFTISPVLFKCYFRRCLIYITIVIVRHILYLVYFSPCLSLGLFMSYLCDFFYLIFTAFNHITLFKQTYFFFVHVLGYFLLFLDDGTWLKKANNFQVAKIQPQGTAQILLDFSPILVWRSL